MLITHVRDLICLNVYIFLFLVLLCPYPFENSRLEIICFFVFQPLDSFLEKRGDQYGNLLLNTMNISNSQYLINDNIPIVDSIE